MIDDIPYLSNVRDIVKIEEPKEGHNNLVQQGQLETMCEHAMRIPEDILNLFKEHNIELPSKHYCNLLYGHKCDFKTRNYCLKQDYVVNLFLMMTRI
jgi:hypothetical protein